MSCSASPTPASRGDLSSPRLLLNHMNTHVNACMYACVTLLLTVQFVPCWSPVTLRPQLYYQIRRCIKTIYAIRVNRALQYRPKDTGISALGHTMIPQVVHPATWLGHQAKGLIGLGFETQCRQGPGCFSDFPKWVPASAGSKCANLADAVQ